MKTEDFESSRREDMEFTGFHLANGDVLSVTGCVRGDGGEEIAGVWDASGKFFALMQQPENNNDFIVRNLTAVDVYASWNGRTLIRTPWFDLKFDSHES